MNEQQSDTSSEGPFPYASTVRVIGTEDEGTDSLPLGTEGVVTHSYGSYTSFNVGGSPHCYWNRNLEHVPDEEQTEELKKALAKAEHERDRAQVELEKGDRVELKKATDSAYAEFIGRRGEIGFKVRTQCCVRFDPIGDEKESPYIGSILLSDLEHEAAHEENTMPMQEPEVIGTDEAPPPNEAEEQPETVSFDDLPEAPRSPLAELVQQVNAANMVFPDVEVEVIIRSLPGRYRGK